MAKRNQTLSLTIELNPEEARRFHRLAKTDDPELQAGIAKSLILGAQEVVDPSDVTDLIGMMSEIRDYDYDLGTAAPQEWADAFSYTREQLQTPRVREAICYWTKYHSDQVSNLLEETKTPHADQGTWYLMYAVATELFEELRRHIRKAVESA